MTLKYGLVLKICSLVGMNYTCHLKTDSAKGSNNILQYIARK